MTNQIEDVVAGSFWSTANGQEFVVLALTEQDGNTWVHYRRNDRKDPQEYSCFVESFVQRYRRITNDKRYWTR